eukprot:6595040-Pyramimonas_sp.AAC.2
MVCGAGGGGQAAGADPPPPVLRGAAERPPDPPPPPRDGPPALPGLEQGRVLPVRGVRGARLHGQPAHRYGPPRSPSPAGAYAPLGHTL